MVVVLPAGEADRADRAVAVLEAHGLSAWVMGEVAAAG
jgi:phosphoribosylaminoimidazole (AIR) synthetase